MGAVWPINAAVRCAYDDAGVMVPLVLLHNCHTTSWESEVGNRERKGGTRRDREKQDGKGGYEREKGGKRGKGRGGEGKRGGSEGKRREGEEKGMGERAVFS